MSVFCPFLLSYQPNPPFPPFLLALPARPSAPQTTCLIAAWVIHARRTGFTPLDPGQWPNFLVVYGGFWMLQNILRPARFALSVALTPLFDRLVDFFRLKAAAVTQREVNKPTAFGITVFFVNVLGTFSYLFLGLFLSTLLAGVPLLPASMRGVPGPV